MNYEKTILVTGGAGFIGSNYLNAMVPRYPNYRFVNVDALTYAADLKNITVAGAPNYVFAQTDIRDIPALEATWREYAPTDVIHFAAESHVDNSITGPHIFFETNIMGTDNLLNLAVTHKLNRFHHISTDEVYGSLSEAERSRTEEDMLLPNSPYSASKAGAEFAVRAYNKTFGLNTVVTRASNNYGPNQHREKFMPLFITNLLSGKKVPVYGTGKNVRDWIYVGDHVEGIDAVFHKGKPGEIYNLGGGNEFANIDIVRKLLSLTGRDENALEYVTDRLGHDMRYSLDSAKATRELGWTPKKQFEEGLRETVLYHRRKHESNKKN
ncbi:MAG TPA: dTDP-glucose 4,6-dehydratase [Candidatus Paceibacterota bacterium]